MANNRSEWNVAIDNRSGYACPSCGYQLSNEESVLVGRDDSTVCSCGAKWQPKEMVVKVTEASLPFFDDKHTRETIWFHASRKKNWLDEVLASYDIPVVHLGTREAALARVADYQYANNVLEQDDNAEWFLYEVRLQDGLLSPRVWEDVDTAFPYTVSELIDSKMASDFVRYVNRYETPGTISLLANPECITVVRETSI